ncbi:MAG TPA: S49 family peptidase, partial [Conexibacter sp.]|nr:S49 family peptidase [Conexibacter sp.]
DPAVGSIVLDVHSHGGTVFGAHELHATILAGRGKGKRIVASINSIAASAAYWIACAADEVVITPGGEAGSIGVYTVHLDVSEALAKAGIKPTIIKAGKYKTEGDPSVPLTDEARRAIQARADAAYDLFVSDVAAGRGVTPAAVRNGYGQGSVLPAKAAKAEGLVDRIATFEEVVQRLLGRKARVGAGARAADDVPELRASDDPPEPDPVPPVPPVDPPAPPPAAAGDAGDLEVRRRRLDLA